MNDIDPNDMTDEELKKKENISLLFYCGLALTIIGVDYLLKMILPNNSYKASIIRLADIVIIFLFFSGYLLYSWKSDMAEFIKRIRIAIPLTLTVLVFAMILFGNISKYSGRIYGGLFIFLVLLLKTPDLKQHFTVIMTLALTAFIILKFSQFLSPAEGEKESYLRATLPFVLNVPIALFFSFYISKVIKGRPFTISSIVYKALKFFITISVFLSLFMLLTIFGKQWGITLPIQLLASSILSIIFIVICYKLDLYPSDRKKDRTKELHEELENFYLDEKAKLKDKK